MSLKDKITGLRTEGKTYNEISKELRCAKSTVSYHCRKLEFNEGLKATNSRKLWVNYRPQTTERHNLISYLVKTGTSGTHIVDVLNISHKELRSYCTKHNLKSEISLTGYARIKQHRRNKKILAVLYKGGACERCGYKKSISAMDFHHRDPKEKDFAISRNTNLAWKRVKAELDKCMLVCANCHRELHEEERGSEYLMFEDAESARINFS